MRIGIFGGMFNPPHLGHLVCASEAYIRLRLDRLLLIPTDTPPHKPVLVDPGPAHRLELCREALVGDERMEASDLEVVRGGTSYTVDTLRALKAQVPHSELFLVLGADAAAGLPGWRSPEQVLSLATVAVAARSGTAPETVTSALESLPGGERTTFFEMPTIAISSTVIRERAAAGESIRYLVPDRVDAYIRRHHLYTNKDGE